MGFGGLWRLGGTRNGVYVELVKVGEGVHSNRYQVGRGSGGVDFGVDRGKY